MRIRSAGVKWVSSCPTDSFRVSAGACVAGTAVGTTIGLAAQAAATPPMPVTAAICRNLRRETLIDFDYLQNAAYYGRISPGGWTVKEWISPTSNTNCSDCAAHILHLPWQLVLMTNLSEESRDDAPCNAACRKRLLHHNPPV